MTVLRGSRSISGCSCQGGSVTSLRGCCSAAILADSRLAVLSLCNLCHLTLHGDITRKDPILQVVILHKELIALLSVLINNSIVGRLLSNGQYGGMGTKQIAIGADDDIVDLVQPEIVHDGQRIDCF